MEEVSLEYINEHYYNWLGKSYKENDEAWEPNHRLSIEESHKANRYVYLHTTKGLLHDIDRQFQGDPKIGSLNRGIKTPNRIFSNSKPILRKKKSTSCSLILNKCILLLPSLCPLDGSQIYRHVRSMYLSLAKLVIYGFSRPVRSRKPSKKKRGLWIGKAPSFKFGDLSLLSDEVEL
jgi:hypothetical protein